VPKAKKNDSGVDTPAYTLREAGRLSGISLGTLHAWTHGPSPIIRLAGDRWSFTNLVEAYTLRALRKAHGMRLSEVRNAVRNAEEKLGLRHPLASRSFLTDQHVRHVECGDDGRARRLYVDADRRLIVIDPAVAFGRPVINGTRVPLEVVAARFRGGEEPADIAADYAIPEAQANHAIRASVPTIRNHPRARPTVRSPRSVGT